MEFLRYTLEGVEHRRDPLFGTWCRINPDRSNRVKHTGPGSHGDHLAALIETSRMTCPFCPEHREQETPTFDPIVVPEGRIRKNEFVLFPNKNPYGEHHAVGILSDEHYIPLDAYPEQMLIDSLEVSQHYFCTLYAMDRRARFPIFVWNFLPPSAGSIVHPHIQLLLESQPAPIIETLEIRCKVWKELYHEDFWDALLQEEQKRNERFIWAQKECAVLTSFSPRGFREILVVMQGSGSIAHLTKKQREIFCAVVVRLLKAYHAMGVGSFNLVTYSPGLDQDPPPFPFHAKLISRPYPSGIYTNDTGFFERMYELWIIDTLPEEVAQHVRAFFDRPF